MKKIFVSEKNEKIIMKSIHGMLENLWKWKYLMMRFF